MLQVGEQMEFAFARRWRLLSCAASGSQRRTSVRMPVIGSECRASPMSSSPARQRPGISALNSSLAMTVMFGLSFSTAARSVPRVSKLASGG